MHWLQSLHQFLIDRQIHYALPTICVWLLQCLVLLWLIPLEILLFTLNTSELMTRALFGGSIRKTASMTSRIVTMARCTGQLVGLCDDWMAAEFLTPLQQLECFIWIIKSDICYDRYVVKHYLCGRCNFGDEAVLSCDDDCLQIVLLGAGNDTRLHRLPNLPAGLYEVDAPSTQQAKLARLQNPNPNVKFVGVDFECGSWMQPLMEAGFNPNSKALFIWEGVSYYLTLDAIQATLESISQCAQGTKLVMDYSVVREPPSIYLESFYRAFRVIGEPWLSNFTDEQVQRLLSSYGFHLEGKPMPARSFAKVSKNLLYYNKTGQSVDRVVVLTVVAATLC